MCVPACTYVNICCLCIGLCIHVYVHTCMFMLMCKYIYTWDPSDLKKNQSDQGIMVFPGRMKTLHMVVLKTENRS